MEWTALGLLALALVVLARRWPRRNRRVRFMFDLSWEDLARDGSKVPVMPKPDNPPEHPHGAPPGQSKPEGGPAPKPDNDLPDQPEVDNELPEPEDDDN